MATKLLHGSLSALNTGINYVPMGSWTLNRVQDVYNKVKDTSPGVVAKSLDRVESVVQRFIANPEGASLEEADFTTNENLQSLKLPETLTDEQLELLNQFVASMIKEKEGREENQTAKKSEPEVDTNREKPTRERRWALPSNAPYPRDEGPFITPNNLLMQSGQ